jgi:hypothetical protein
VRYYIATSLANVAHQQAMRDHVHWLDLTYDWSEHGQLGKEAQDRWASIAEDEIDGVVNADYLILLLPGGRGAHIELGAALATGKPTFIIGSQTDFDKGTYGYPCLFYNHPCVVARVVEDDPSKWPERFEEAWGEYKARLKEQRKKALDALRRS